MKRNILTHYVYLYRSPLDGSPVYVGKGWGKRAWSHIGIAKSDPEKHRNKYFARTLAKWLRDGHQVDPEIVATFDTHEEALIKEAELILQFGRHKLGSGSLLNLTDGGEGTTGRGLIVVVDGLTYPTIREAALRYGIAEVTVRNRINVLKYTIRQAFGLDPAPEYPPSGTKSVVIDGEVYSSISSACKHFGLSPNVVSARLNRTEWTIEQIFGLEQPPAQHGPNAVPIIVGDEEFSSLNEACKVLAPHLSPGTIKNRIHPRGWTIEQAFGLEPSPNNKGGPRNPVTAFGKNYNSVSEAARAHGVHHDTVAWRLRNGRTLEQALIEKRNETYRVGAMDFKNLTAACEFFGLSRQAVLWRLKQGWTIEDAFKPKRGK